MTDQSYSLITPFVKERLNEIEWRNTKSQVAAVVDRPRTPGSKTIRLDFDYSLDGLTDETMLFNVFDICKPIIIETMAEDVSDLLVNGDINSDDPLLKVIDGEQKLGIRFKDVYFTNAIYIEEFAPKLGTIGMVSYTVFLALEGIE